MVLSIRPLAHIHLSKMVELKRAHRHIMETTLTLLHQAQLPVQFWLEALLTSVYLINRLPHFAVNFQIPYTLLYNTVLDYSFLKPFGCLCFPWLKHYVSNKLTPKSVVCVFLGYCSTIKGDKCFDPVSNKVYTSRHVNLIETKFPYVSLTQSGISLSSSSSVLPSSSLYFDISLATADSVPMTVPTVPVTTSVPSSSVHHIPVTTTLSLVPLSSPTSTPLILPSPAPSPAVHPMVTRSKNGIFKPNIPLSLSLTTTPEPHEPKSFAEAVKNPNWQKAMSSEYEALLSQGTWTLVPPPNCANIIGCH